MSPPSLVPKDSRDPYVPKELFSLLFLMCLMMQIADI